MCQTTEEIRTQGEKGSRKHKTQNTPKEDIGRRKTCWMNDWTDLHLIELTEVLRKFDQIRQDSKNFGIPEVNIRLASSLKWFVFRNGTCILVNSVVL